MYIHLHSTVYIHSHSRSKYWFNTAIFIQHFLRIAFAHYLVPAPAPYFPNAIWRTKGGLLYEGAEQRPKTPNTNFTRAGGDSKLLDDFR